MDQKKKKKARNDSGSLFRRTEGGFWYGRWWSGPKESRVRRKKRLHRDKREAQKLLDKLIAKEKAIDAGLIDRPKEERAERLFSDVIEEYLEWGKACGGRGGRPWSTESVRKKEQRLLWWEEKLEFEFVSQLEGSLALVEHLLREARTYTDDQGNEHARSGKTLQNYAEAIAALCDWCVARDYIERDPLKSLRKFDTTPRVPRRALTVNEIHRLFAAAPKKRRLTYQVAVCTGLRVGELSALTIAHLDSVRGGLRLDAAWTKNRKPGFQPLPSALVEELSKSAEGKARDRRLLYVPAHPAELLDKDLKAAGIPKVTDQGKLDFHALRVAFTTLVVETGTDVKSAQALARHSTPDLTLNVYARARDERLSQVVEQVGTELLGSYNLEKLGPLVGPKNEREKRTESASDDDEDTSALVGAHSAGSSIPPASTTHLPK